MPIRKSTSNRKTSKNSKDPVIPQPEAEKGDAEMTEKPAAFSYKTVFSGQRPPVRVYTSSYEEADELCGVLRGPLGFDMEWQVTWLRIPRRTAVVQVSDQRMILVIQINDMSC